MRALRLPRRLALAIFDRDEVAATHEIGLLDDADLAQAAGDLLARSLKAGAPPVPAKSRWDLLHTPGDFEPHDSRPVRLRPSVDYAAPPLVNMRLP